MSSENSYPIHITIGTTEHKVEQLTMTATELKKLAGVAPQDYDLYLEVNGPQETTMIPDDGPAVTLVDDMQFFVIHRQNQPIPIIIDTVQKFATKHAMTGAELKELGEIPANFALFLVPTARADERISDDQTIYLVKDEQFVSMKSNINNGSTAVQLPQNEMQYLESQGFEYELQRNPANQNEIFLIVHNFDLGENYTSRQVDLLVKIPQGFPNAAMDMFWVYPAVMKANGQSPAAVCQEGYLNRSWQRFSRHRDANTWNPVMGGLRAHFTFIAEALRKGE